MEFVLTNLSVHVEMGATGYLIASSPDLPDWSLSAPSMNELEAQIPTSISLWLESETALGNVERVRIIKREIKLEVKTSPRLGVRRK